MRRREQFEWWPEYRNDGGVTKIGVTWIEGQQFAHDKGLGYIFVGFCGVVLVLVGFVTMVAELPLISWPAYALGAYMIYLGFIPTPMRTVLFTTEGDTETPNGLTVGPRFVRALPTFNVADIENIEVETRSRNRYLPYDSGRVVILAVGGETKAIATRLTADEALIVGRQLVLALDAVRELIAERSEARSSDAESVFFDRFGQTSI